MTEHRELGARYFNAAWDLIDLPERTADQDRDLLGLVFASRQHWIDGDGTTQNLVVADWQVAHAASLLGLADLALVFASTAVESAESADVPVWLRASVHEGLARAHAAAGDRQGYDREVEATQRLLELVDDAEGRDLVASQLASIPPPA